VHGYLGVAIGAYDRVTIACWYADLAKRLCVRFRALATVCLSMCVCLCLSVYPFLCLYVCISVCLCVCMYVRLFGCWVAQVDTLCDLLRARCPTFLSQQDVILHRAHALLQRVRASVVPQEREQLVAEAVRSVVPLCVCVCEREREKERAGGVYRGQA
jgi:hypothetical protein